MGSDMRANGPRWLVWLVIAAGVGPVIEAADRVPRGDADPGAIGAGEPEHWAYRSVVRPPIPAVTDRDWPRRPLDRFVLARLEAAGLRPAAEADRATWLRRVTFDLTGLPPTPQEIDRFLGDRDHDAAERVVDRLLGSPDYGRRWAQHWLDVARFAETDGFEHDKPRPDAWRYRDWVVAAFNGDMPYDRFLSLQIAGDLFEPGDPEAAIATAFCLAGPDMPDINSQVERKHVLLNEITGTVGAAVMSLQVGCAACHDHKFDPISQADFYQLRAFFDPAVDVRRNRSVDYLQGVEGGATMSHVAIRGDWRRTGAEVSPAFLGVIGDRGIMPGGAAGADGADGGESDLSGYDRRDLARWLTDPRHPLTARSIVNRVWQHHFGRGLVATPNDFGVTGARPTHPDLLDYLATELVRRRWSLKGLHREIVLSATYRTQGFDVTRGVDWKTLLAEDPENRLLGRFPRRRLEGEAIRDAMFAVSGALDHRHGGPGVMPPLPEELQRTLLKGQWKASERPADHYRRSIYLFARRNLPYPFLSTFDRPVADTSCAARARSTTAPQALFLLNSAITSEAAGRLAERLREEHPDDISGRIVGAYVRLFGRPPGDEELDQAVAFLRSRRDQPPGELPSDADAVADDRLAFRELCRGLLNANPFVYVD